MTEITKEPTIYQAVHQRAEAPTNSPDEVNPLDDLEVVGLGFLYQDFMDGFDRSALRVAKFQSELKHECGKTIEQLLERVRRIECLTTAAIKSAGELAVEHNSQRIASELDHENYRILLFEEQASTEYLTTRKADLEDAKEGRTFIEDACARMMDRVGDLPSIGDSKNNFEVGVASQSKQLFEIGVEISRLNAEIITLEKKLFDMRERILEYEDTLRLQRQTAAIITNKIEDLVPPANDPNNQDLFHGNSQLVIPVERPKASVNRIRVLEPSSLSPRPVGSGALTQTVVSLK